MEFKILRNFKRGEEFYTVWYLDELDPKAPKWKQVLWEDTYLDMNNYNCTYTIEEAKQKAAEFKNDYELKNGVVVETFDL